MAEKSLPEFEKRVFCCPHCNAISKQDWFEMRMHDSNYLPNEKHFNAELNCFITENDLTLFKETNFSAAECHNCQKLSIWNTKDERMVFPYMVTLLQIIWIISVFFYCISYLYIVPLLH